MGNRLLDLVPGYLSKVCSLWEKLSKEAVGVFIDASLPGGIGMGEVGMGLQSLRDRFMLHKL